MDRQGADLAGSKSFDEGHEVEPEVSHWWSTPGLTLGPGLVNTFLGDLGDGTECSLTKSVDDTEPGGGAATINECATNQRDLCRLEK